MAIYQQTLFLNAEDLSPCVEKGEKDGEENFVSTNFDTMVSEFEASLQDDSKTVLSKMFISAANIIACIVIYADDATINKVKSGLSLPDNIRYLRL